MLGNIGKHCIKSFEVTVDVAQNSPHVFLFALKVHGKTAQGKRAKRVPPWVKETSIFAR